MPVSQTNPSLVGNVSKILKRAEKVWLPVWNDRDGNPIMNSAKQLPIKPYYHAFGVVVYDIEIVYPGGLSDSALHRQADSLNSVEWRGTWPRYSAWISEIHCGGLMQIGNDLAEQVSYVVRCIKRTNGWRFEHPDVGYIYFDGADWKSFSDEQGRVPIGKLDGAGGMLSMTANMVINLSDLQTEVDIASEIGY